jgi:phosphatidylethanolamine-binding protein (PEBP) family uncharacterized protein
LAPWSYRWWHRYIFTVYALSIEKRDVPADFSGAGGVDRKRTLAGESDLYRVLRTLKELVL